jgi:hypothetical protein
MPTISASPVQPGKRPGAGLPV